MSVGQSLHLCHRASLHGQLAALKLSVQVVFFSKCSVEHWFETPLPFYLPFIKYVGTCQFFQLWLKFASKFKGMIEMTDSVLPQEKELSFY